ncbi:MAG: hypothetical protein V7708_10780 [Oceanicoccus sp.]
MSVSRILSTKKSLIFVPTLALISIVLPSANAVADGSSIDKIYHPYVQPLEREIEYRSRYQKDSHDDLDGQQRHLLGFGRSFSDRVFGELYLEGSDNSGDSFSLDAIEVEAKVQLTEQGEYDNDWGLLFELEREKSDNKWEARSTLIALHEWTDWIVTTNFGLIYEWGDHINNEWETSLSTQFRYRYKQTLEPSIEIYLSEDSKGIGPVLSGTFRLEGRRKFIWESGVILGMNSKTADTSWKFNIEYEF